MRIKYLLYILFIALVTLSYRATAQSMSLDNMANIKVDQLSDTQIIQAWQKMQSMGMSEQEAYASLAQRHMPDDQIQALKDRVTILGLNNSKPVLKTETKKSDFSRKEDDSVIVSNQKKNKPVPPPQKLKVYGADFFNNSTNKFEPNFSVATSKGYVLGPGDEVIVFLTGLNELDQRNPISPDGNLLIPHSGLVYLNGFTIDQATSIIKKKMVKAYPALQSGQTQLTINLGSTRRIQVTTNGQAKTPGASYSISSIATLFNVLYISGGPNQNGSLRNIQLIRNNKIYKTIDFYDYLQHGTMGANIRLEDQDVINFPVYTKRIGIGGEVKTPAIYELKDNETLEDLIRYAGGFTDTAYTGTAKIDQINALQHEVKDVPANMFSNYIPHNGDLVQIGSVTKRYTNRIILEGAVYRPGVYELTAGLTLSQLLKNAQGLTPDAYMELGYIKRTMPDLKRTLSSFVPSEIINGKNDVPLLREDTVVILGRDVFTSNQKITVQGFVREPSVFTYRQGMKLADAIAMAGGFKDEAAAHHVEVSRIIKNLSDTVADQLVTTFPVDMTDQTDPKQNIELQPMDQINVLRLVNDRPLGEVAIRGEVAFPANYPVQKRDETVLDFLNRAGGVTPYGLLENAQVYRKGIRVNIDFTKNNAEANKTKILLPGDSIYVPRVISYVEVSGAVNNPQYISYKGQRFKYYINAAAGTTENARLKGAYIKYPNGLNQPVRHFLFFRHYPKVKPGSKIVVPEKEPKLGLKVGFDDLGGIAAALTAIVSIIAILHK